MNEARDELDLYAERTELLYRYRKRLFKELKKKTGFDFSEFAMGDCSIRCIEKFVHSNGLFDTKKIWKIYQPEYKKIQKEIDLATMAILESFVDGDR